MKSTVSKLATTLAIAAVSLLSVPASAAIVVSNAGLTEFDNFYDFSSPSLASNTAVTNQYAGLSFAPLGGGGGVRANSCGVGSWDGSAYGMSGDTLNTFGPGCSTNNANNNFSLGFDAAVSAVSFNIYSSGLATWSTYLDNVLVETVQTNFLYGGNGTGVLTFSGVAFDEIRFAEGSAGQYIFFDNLASVDAVPEPAALGLFGLGLLGLVARRRRLPR